MNEAPFERVQRRQQARSAGAAHFVRDPARHPQQALFTAVAIVLGVQNDAHRRAIVYAPGMDVADQLQRLQRSAVLADHDGRVVGHNVQRQALFFALIDVHVGGQIGLLQELADELHHLLLEGVFRFQLGRLRLVVRQVHANANLATLEKSGALLIDHFDVDLVLREAQRFDRLVDRFLLGASFEFPFRHTDPS